MLNFRVISNGVATTDSTALDDAMREFVGRLFDFLLSENEGGLPALAMAFGLAQMMGPQAVLLRAQFGGTNEEWLNKLAETSRLAMADFLATEEASG